MRAVDVVRKIAPLAKQNYVSAFVNGDDLLRKHGIETPGRLAHFLAQVLHESGGLRFDRENMNYRAGRLLEVFGANHSAKITPAEAAKLEGRPEAIAERVYGLGNPVKAADLGNTQPGDGFLFRGGGLLQTTGRYNYTRIAEECHVPFDQNPDLVTAPDHALKPALFEWTQNELNKFADADDILAISRAINFGNTTTSKTPNGFSDRKSWYAKAIEAIGDATIELSKSSGEDGAKDRTMNLSEVQRRLKILGLYLKDVDGDYGPATAAAIDALFLNQSVKPGASWSEVRKIVAAGQVLCRLEGIEVGEIDGLVGPQTRDAFERYAERSDPPAPANNNNWRDDDAPDETSGETPDAPPPAAPAVATTITPRVWPREAGVAAYFGAPGTNQATLTLPFPMRIAWNTSHTITRTSCNVKVKEPLERIWTRTLEHYGLTQIRSLRLDLFGGCLNVRRKRGGSSWSMHAFGIAWDVDPSNNALRMGRDQATLDAPIYDAFWSFVEDEGAISLGRKRNYDWMHFQFARL